MLTHGLTERLTESLQYCTQNARLTDLCHGWCMTATDTQCFETALRDRFKAEQD